MIQERVASPDLMSEHASIHVGPDSSPPCHKRGIIEGPLLNGTTGHEYDYTIHQSPPEATPLRKPPLQTPTHRPPLPCHIYGSGVTSADRLHTQITSSDF